MLTKTISLQKNISLLILDMQGLQPSVASQVKQTTRSPRVPISGSKDQATDKLLQFAVLISSTIIYNEIGQLEKIFDVLEPIAKFCTLIMKELGAGNEKLSMVSNGSTGDLSARSNGTSFLDITQTVNQDFKEIMCP